MTQEGDKTYAMQVPGTLYSSGEYANVHRFVGYYLQKQLVHECVAKVSKPKILEIGKGDGFLEHYLERQGYDVTTLDFAPDLAPDFVASVLDVDQVFTEKFDVVCCYEVLEHLEYADAAKAIEKLKKVTGSFLLLSVPQVRLYCSIYFRMPILGACSMYASLPFPMRHRFDGEHYWELGKRGYSHRSFRKLLSQSFVVLKEFTHPLDTYHRFFQLAPR